MGSLGFQKALTGGGGGGGLPDPRDLVDDGVDTVTGIADHAAGSVDESVGRQFDDQEGGGFADEAASTGAGFLDWAAGDVDEFVGRQTSGVRRQFDSEQGGGVVDDFVPSPADVVPVPVGGNSGVGIATVGALIVGAAGLAFALARTGGSGS